MQKIDIFPWNEHFNTGLITLDDQHRGLIKLLNRLATIVAYEVESKELNVIFNDLIEYASYHFQVEKDLWDEYFKEDLVDNNHQAEHQKFIAIILHFKEEQSEKSLEELAGEVIEFLSLWLASHILQTDRYIAYVVLGVKEGLSLDISKNNATQKILASSELLMDIVRSTYSTLSTNTLQLMRELKVHKSYEKKVTYQNEYRELLLGMASLFINIPLKNVDAAIDSALEKMAIFVNADRAYIFDYNMDKDTTTNTFEWHGDDISPQIQDLQNIDINLLPGWLPKHKNGEYVLIEDVSALPKGKLYDVLAPQGIKSLLTLPLFEDKKCKGFIGFDSVKSLHNFSEYEITLLNFFSVLLGNISDRKRIETELSLERNFFKTLVQTIPDLVWLKDTQGKYLMCNTRFEDFFGATEKEIKGKTDYDFVESSLADFFRFNDQKVVENGGVHVSEKELSFSIDNHKEIVHTTKVPMHDIDGSIIGVLGVGRDITEKKEFEKELILERDRFEHYLQTVESIIISLDVKGDIILINRKACDILGYESEELIGKPWFELCSVQPMGLEQLYPLFLKIIKGSAKNIAYYENMIQTKSGEQLLIAWNNSYLTDDKGTIVGTLSSGEDITQRRKSEESLRLAASVFSHTREGIIIASPDNKIVDVNQAVERITGYKKEELLGKNPSMLSSGQHENNFYNEMWEAVSAEGFWRGEVWNRHKNGEAYLEMITITQVKDKNQKLVNYLAIFSDITLFKEQQKQLELNAHYDALTGLANRVLFMDRLSQAMIHTRRSKLTLAVAYLDLDGFKEINDTYGHKHGDTLLQVVSSRMKKTLRNGDTIARIGGDEFVVVMIGLQTQENCAPLLKRLLLAVSQKVISDDIEMQVTASIGVSFFISEDQFELEELLHRADQAMYKAKVSGKNRCHIYDS